MKNDDYPIFRFWYQTLDIILTAVERFPRHARFSLAEAAARNA